MVERRSGSYAAREANLEMVQLCSLLLGALVRQLDPGIDYGWNRSELVAGHLDYLYLSIDKLNRDVLQFEVRFRIPHW